MESDNFAELERLWALKESGALSEEEFQKLKAQTLGKTRGTLTEGSDPGRAAGISDRQAKPSRGARTSTAKGCGIVAGIGLVFIIILAVAAPSDQTRNSENVTSGESMPASPREREAEIDRLLKEAATVPASRYSENERIYSRLAQLDTSNEKYAQKRDEYAEKNRLQATYASNPERALEITRYQGRKGGFGSVLLVSLTVKNKAAFPIRDFELKCVHQGPSGSDMDMNVRTVYERIPAHGSKHIPEVSMGFIHSQATSSRCEITDAAVG